MRDNVHQSRNKIVRYLGVLVAAALVATLGLPSAAQAQTPAAPTVTGDRRRHGRLRRHPYCNVGAVAWLPIPTKISGCSNIQSLASHGTMRRR